VTAKSDTAKILELESTVAQQNAKLERQDDSIKKLIDKSLSLREQLAGCTCAEAP